MQSQVVLLHSQLLFERYQCVQHAKRNRRLLSKARSAAHVTEELVSLRDQLHQKEVLVSSLQHQLMKVTESRGTRGQQLGGEGEGNLARESSILKDNNARLTEELWRMKERNKELEEELKSCNEKLLSLSNERQQLEPRLQRVSQLQVEVDSLAKRCHQLKELHQQQRAKVASLQCQSQQGWEWKVQSAALLREKEDSARRTHGLQQALGACQARLRELEKEGSIKELEVEKLHLQLEQERERAWCKMKALEGKYGSMKVIGQQLESHVMELKSHTPLQRRKLRSSNKHQRNPSSTSSVSLATPPPHTVAT